MKKEREIFWTLPTPKGHDVDKNAKWLTKEEEEKLFAGKLKHKDVVGRPTKPKVASKSKAPVTKGKPK